MLHTCLRIMCSTLETFGGRPSCLRKMFSEVSFVWRHLHKGRGQDSNYHTLPWEVLIVRVGELKPHLLKHPISLLSQQVYASQLKISLFLPKMNVQQDAEREEIFTGILNMLPK